MSARLRVLQHLSQTGYGVREGAPCFV